jgi:hypothetical protein
LARGSLGRKESRPALAADRLSVARSRQPASAWAPTFPTRPRRTAAAPRSVSAPRCQSARSRARPRSHRVQATGRALRGWLRCRPDVVPLTKTSRCESRWLTYSDRPLHEGGSLAGNDCSDCSSTPSEASTDAVMAVPLAWLAGAIRPACRDRSARASKSARCSSPRG